MTKAKSKAEEKKDQMKTVEHVRNKEAKESILEVQQQLIKQKGFLVKQLALLQNEKLESTDIESVAKDAEERKEDKERTLGTAILRHPTLHRPKYVGRRRPTKFARTIQKEKADELLEEKEAEIETEESKTEINAEYINVVSEESPTNEADEALSSNKENQVAIQKHEGEGSEYYRKEDTLSAEGGVRLSWWGEEVGFLTKELDAMIRDMATSVDSLIQETKNEEVKERDAEKEAVEEALRRQLEKTEKEIEFLNRELEWHKIEENDAAEREEEQLATKLKLEEMDKEVASLNWKLARANELIEANKVQLEMANEKQMILRLELRSSALENKRYQTENTRSKARIKELEELLKKMSELLTQKEDELRLWKSSSRKSVSLSRSIKLSDIQEANERDSLKGTHKRENITEEDGSATKQREDTNDESDDVDVESLMKAVVFSNQKVEKLTKELKEKEMLITRMGKELESIQLERQQERETAKRKESSAKAEDSDANGLHKIIQYLQDESNSKNETLVVSEEMIRLQTQLIELLSDALKQIQGHMKQQSSSTVDEEEAQKQREEMQKLREEISFLKGRRNLLLLTTQPISKKELTKSIKRQSILSALTTSSPLPALPVPSPRETTSFQSQARPSSTSLASNPSTTASSEQTSLPTVPTAATTVLPPADDHPIPHAEAPLADDPRTRLSSRQRIVSEIKSNKIKEKKIKKERKGHAERDVEWLPDVATPVCFGCKSEFTLINRRHHCRNCGMIFCSHCASLSCPIEKLGYKEPVRVCTLCFIQITDIADPESALAAKRLTDRSAVSFLHQALGGKKGARK